MTTRLLVGDARQRIAEIPDGTVDLVVTSPPFLALRKYGDDDREMGSEGTPADFLDALLDLTVEFRRVLAPHGSIAIELGDTYSGSGGAGGDMGVGEFRGLGVGGLPYRGARRRGGGMVIESGGAGWPLAKSLALIPQLYPASLAYGCNLLRPGPYATFAPWRVRNIITWCRPNPPVGALGDKVRPATSYITVACPSARRWFDLDGVRTEHKRPDLVDADGALKNGATRARMNRGNPGYHIDADDPLMMNPAGAPPLDWWDDALNPNDPTDHMTLVMPTQPYPGAHYATWPAKLAQRLIDMMCPLKVCVTCGKPSERLVESERFVAHPQRASQAARSNDPGFGQEGHTTYTTVGWSDCGHDNWRPGHVLDPFSGSATTLAVASGMGRDATGVELYEANAELSIERCGMFLEIIR